MKILIAGSSGFIGKALCHRLKQHDIFRLVRRTPANNKEIYWHPENYTINPKDIEGFAAIIHLGGAGVADKIWTDKYRKLLRDSRIESTKALCSAILKCSNKPTVYISSSGVNFYGANSNDALTETSPTGTSFLSGLCRDWEGASAQLDDAGIRRVLLRTSIVLGEGGGMLAKLSPIFKFGLGGPIGLGKRFFPWISLHDMCSLIEFSLNNTALSGPINAVAPEVISNLEFTKALATHLHRPAIFPVPTPIFKLLPSDMVEDLFLCNLKIVPQKLSKSEFSFQHPDIKTFFKSL